MITRKVQVTSTVEVTIDELKFDAAFMQEFRESFYNFTTLDDHIEHLGQMYARGLYENGDFIEGYGRTQDMGIKFESSRAGFDVEIVK